MGWNKMWTEWATANASTCLGFAHCSLPLPINPFLPHQNFLIIAPISSHTPLEMRKHYILAYVGSPLFQRALLKVFESSFLQCHSMAAIYFRGQFWRIFAYKVELIWKIISPGISLIYELYTRKFKFCMVFELVWSYFVICTVIITEKLTGEWNSLELYYYLESESPTLKDLQSKVINKFLHRGFFFFY